MRRNNIYCVDVFAMKVIWPRKCDLYVTMKAIQMSILLFHELVKLLRFSYSITDTRVWLLFAFLSVSYWKNLSTWANIYAKQYLFFRPCCSSIFWFDDRTSFSNLTIFLQISWNGARPPLTLAGCPPKSHWQWLVFRHISWLWEKLSGKVGWEFMCQLLIKVLGRN